MTCAPDLGRRPRDSRRQRPSLRVSARLAAALALGAATLFPGGLLPAQEGSAPAAHVVLVSVDGLRPEFYLDARWPAPRLRQGAAAGAHAQGVRSVFPSVTYPAHTTLVTGALPARHGIYYNEPFEPDGPSGRWYWEADSIRVRTLWDAVRQAGGKTAAFSWPVTVGAPIDFDVPEVWSVDGTEGRAAIVGRLGNPPGIVEELEREATGSLVPLGPGGRPDEGAWTREWWDERTTRMAEYVLERYQPALLTVHLIDVDHQEHEHGREGPEVERAVAAVDAAIGRLEEAASRVGIDDQTAFVVVGDHGFVDTSTLLAPNAWLVAAELLPAGGEGSWRARFHSGGGSGFLHLRERDDAEALQAVRRLLNDLDPGVKRRFRVVERAELDSLGADPRVPLALAAAEGVAFTLRASGPAVGPTNRGTHGYLPDQTDDILTGFAAWGAGVQPGAVAPRMDLEDVAPFVAALLGVDLRAPDGVLRPGLLARRERR